MITMSLDVPRRAYPSEAWQSSHMEEGLASGRLDLIGRYMHDRPEGEPPKAPPWTSESASAVPESGAERPANVRVEHDPTEVTAHAAATLAQGADSLHRFHDTYDRIAGAAMLAERAERRRAAAGTSEEDDVR